MITPLQDYEKSCNRIKSSFIRSLYPDKEDQRRILAHEEGYWVGDEVGRVFCWWDWFVDMEMMIGYFRYGYTPEQFFEYYDVTAEIFANNQEKPIQDEGVIPNMKNWLKLQEEKA